MGLTGCGASRGNLLPESSRNPILPFAISIDEDPSVGKELHDSDLRRALQNLSERSDHLVSMISARIHPSNRDELRGTSISQVPISVMQPDQTVEVDLLSHMLPDGLFSDVTAELTLRLAGEEIEERLHHIQVVVQARLPIRSQCVDQMALPGTGRTRE